MFSVEGGVGAPDAGFVFAGFGGWGGFAEEVADGFGVAVGLDLEVEASCDVPVVVGERLGVLEFDSHCSNFPKMVEYASR